MLFVQYCGDCK